MDVDLVYLEGCPNITKARERLLSAFKMAGILPRWQEWYANDPESPKHVRGWGSPTILVNGQDIAGMAKNVGDTNCRVYGDPNGNGKLDGAPPETLIKDALLLAVTRHETGGVLPDKSYWATLLALIPAIGAALLPTCPACWPIYAGLFASIGVEFAEDSPYVVPLIIFFLMIALITLGYRAQSRRGYGPLMLGIIGTTVILISKFAIISEWLLHGGVALMLAAFVWNVWPRKNQTDASETCSACLPKRKTTFTKESA